MSWDGRHKGLMLLCLVCTVALVSSVPVTPHVRDGGQVKEYRNRPYTMKQDLLHIDTQALQAQDMAGEAATAFADIAEELRVRMQPPSFKPYARDAKPATGNVFDASTLSGLSSAKSSGGRGSTGFLSTLKGKASSNIPDKPRPSYDSGSPSVNEIAKKGSLTLLDKTSGKLSFLEEYEVIRRHDRTAAESHKGAACGEECSLLELEEEATHWVSLRQQKLQERKATEVGVSFLEEEADLSMKAELLQFSPPQLLILTVAGGYGTLGAGVELVYDVATYSWATFAFLGGGVDPLAISLAPHNYLKDVFQSFFHKPKVSLTATISVGLGWKGKYLPTCLPDSYSAWFMSADVNLAVVGNLLGVPPPFSVPIMAAVSSDGPSKASLLSMDFSGIKTVAVGLRVSSLYSPATMSIGYTYYWSLGQERFRTFKDFLLNLDPIGDFFSVLFGSGNQPEDDHPLKAAHTVLQIAGLPISIIVGMLGMINELIGETVPYNDFKCQDRSTSLRSIWTLLGDLFTPERLAAAERNELAVRYGLQGPDAQGIFVSPGSLGVTPLYFRQDASRIYWQWSPDKVVWMSVKDKVVRGGQWNGQSPVQRNIDVLIALEAAQTVGAARADIQKKLASGLQAAQTTSVSSAAANTVASAEAAALSQLQLHALARRFDMTGPDNAGVYTYAQGCTVYFRYTNIWQAKLPNGNWIVIASGPDACSQADGVRAGLVSATVACARANRAGKAATPIDQAHCVGLTGPNNLIYTNPRDNTHSDFFFRFITPARGWEFSTDKVAWNRCADYPEGINPGEENLTIIRALAMLAPGTGAITARNDAPHGTFIKINSCINLTPSDNGDIDDPYWDCTPSGTAQKKSTNPGTFTNGRWVWDPNTQGYGLRWDNTGGDITCGLRESVTLWTDTVHRTSFTLTQAVMAANAGNQQFKRVDLRNCGKPTCGYCLLQYSYNP